MDAGETIDTVRRPASASVASLERGLRNLSYILRQRRTYYDTRAKPIWDSSQPLPLPCPLHPLIALPASRIAHIAGTEYPEKH